LMQQFGVMSVDNFIFEAPILVNKHTADVYNVGQFFTPSLHELQARHPTDNTNINIRVGMTSKSVTNLMVDPNNQGAIFQVASQFNCLESPSPYANALDSLAMLDYDRTQGPACCIACGAATIYRTCFMDPVNTLKDVEQAL